jgi:hypothetical protein
MLATRPPYVLAIATAAAMLLPATLPTRDVKPTRPPTADDIIAASLAAQGGCARLERVRRFAITGHVLYEDTGESAALTLHSEVPRNLEMVMVWPGNIDYRLEVRDDVVTIDQGIIDGTRDHQVITGSEREQLLIDASFACHPSAKHLYRSSALVGITSFDGQRAYQIDRTTASGLTRTVYIAVETLLPIGEERDTVNERPSWDPPGPPELARVRFSSSDFRWVDGVRIAFRSHQTMFMSDGARFDNTLFVETAATSNR